MSPYTLEPGIQVCSKQPNFLIMFDESVGGRVEIMGELMQMRGSWARLRRGLSISHVVMTKAQSKPKSVLLLMRTHKHVQEEADSQALGSSTFVGPP